MEDTKKVKDYTSDEARFNKLLRTLFSVIELSGFRLNSRIELVDKRTGKEYK